METKKKTAQKKTATSKPKVPKQKTKEELERDIANGDKAFARAIKESQDKKDLIRFYIPKEVSIGGDYFERSFNGHIIRLKVGRIVELPRFLVDYIESCIQIRRLSEEKASVYQQGSGKEIGF